MKMKSGLLGLGLLVTAGVFTVSCGGDSDDNNNTGKGGSSGSTGTAGKASTGTAGTTGNSTAGTTGNSTAGTTGNSTAGTTGNTGGTGSNTGGTGNNNNGGMQGNDGGASNNPACPAAEPTDGAECTAMTGFQGCDYGTMNCRCQRVRGGGGPGGGDAGAPAIERAWNCNEQMDPGGFGGFGAGGDGNLGNVDCPATKPANMSTCTGTGACPYDGGGCFCANGTFFCN